MPSIIYKEKNVSTILSAVPKIGAIDIASPLPQGQDSRIRLESRRYIGCKAKLVDWIFELIDVNTEDCHTFCDIFAGTGAVAHHAIYRKSA